MASSPRILAISTEIGRGHPSYLDSVLKELSEQPGVAQDSLRLLTVEDIGELFVADTKLVKFCRWVQIPGETGGEIVHYHNLMTEVYQCVDDVGADEPAPPVNRIFKLPPNRLSSFYGDALGQVPRHVYRASSLSGGVIGQQL